MSRDSAKIIIVASGDDCRDAAYVIVRGLKEYGHDPLIYCSPDAKTKIKPDIPLGKETSIDGFGGIVILDDGGDPKSCAMLVKKANDGELAIGGLGKGCLMMSSCGVLKDHYVCSGLPDEAYEEGVTRIDSPSARSDMIVTCADVGMAEGFLSLFIDAIGGKAKRVVTGKDPLAPNSPEAVLLASRPLAEIIGGVVDFEDSDGGTRIAAKRTPSGWKIEAEGVVRDAVEATCVAFQSALSDIDGVNGINVRVTLRDDRPTINGIDVLEPAAPGPEQRHEDDPRMTKMIVEREMANEGMWIQPDGKLAILTKGKFQRLEPTDALRELRSQALAAIEKEIQAEHRGKDDLSTRRARRVARRARHRFVLAFELLGKPGEPCGLAHSRFEVVDQKPTFFSLPNSDSRKSAMEASNHARSTGSMVYLVADGNVMEIGPNDVMFEFDGPISRKADLYPSGVSGPWANLDVPMFERVFEYDEGDDWLKDREKAISDQPRYNPEYDSYGFYLKFLEPRNVPYDWAKRYEEGSYPMRNILNINR